MYRSHILLQRRMQEENLKKQEESVQKQEAMRRGQLHVYSSLVLCVLCSIP